MSDFPAHLRAQITDALQDDPPVTPEQAWAALEQATQDDELRAGLERSLRRFLSGELDGVSKPDLAKRVGLDVPRERE